MAGLTQPIIETVTVTLSRTAAGVGFTNVEPLPTLGLQGRLLTVKARMDATNQSADAGTLYIADDALSSAPSDDVVFYESASIAFGGAGSATDAALMDALDVPAPYRVSSVGDLRIGLDITALDTGNNTEVTVTITAEVWG